MGESGSGKSTLLNMIATLDKPTSGKLYLNGDDLTQIKEKAAAALRREHLGLFSKILTLLDTISVKDNILPHVVLSRKSIKVAIYKPKLQELAEKLEIHYFIRKISVRSIWWTKRNVWQSPGRSLPIQHYFLADEPTGALDSKTPDQLLDIFEQLNQNGQTILMVTHSSLRC